MHNQVNRIPIKVAKTTSFPFYNPVSSTLTHVFCGATRFFDIKYKLNPDRNHFDEGCMLHRVIDCERCEVISMSVSSTVAINILGRRFKTAHATSRIYLIKKAQLSNS